MADAVALPSSFVRRTPFGLGATSFALLGAIVGVSLDGSPPWGMVAFYLPVGVVALVWAWRLRQRPALIFDDEGIRDGEGDLLVSLVSGGPDLGRARTVAGLALRARLPATCRLDCSQSGLREANRPAGDATGFPVRADELNGGGDRGAAQPVQWLSRPVGRPRRLQAPDQLTADADQSCVTLGHSTRTTGRGSPRAPAAGAARSGRASRRPVQRPRRTRRGSPPAPGRTPRPSSGPVGPVPGLFERERGYAQVALHGRAARSGR